MKRFFDLILSFVALVLLSPFLLLCSFIVWAYDKGLPFYVAPRVGKNGELFSMIKLRSMRVNADKTGVDSTSSNDSRITPLGKIMRRYKLDELPQLLNVLKGDMSFVGPRPNVKRETDLYSQEEKKILEVKPGITDFSSIIFSDEGEILKDSQNPDVDYNQLIRPWKSRLGILYKEKKSFLLDLQILYLTGLCLFNRPKALKAVQLTLRKLTHDEKLIEVCGRSAKLSPSVPPGLETVVVKRG